MIFRNKIVVKAPAELLWPFLTDTGKLKEWNSNIRALIPISAGELAAGSRYRVRCRIEHTENNFLAEVLECEPMVRISTHLTGGDFPRKGYALETYELSEHRLGTLIRQTIEIQLASAGPVKKLFVLIRHLVGGSRGKQGLKQLKRLVEQQG